jgi:hypothetical protein
MSHVHSKRYSKGKSKRRVTRKNTRKHGGGCGCDKHGGKKQAKRGISKKVGGYGAASYQPFEQHAGNVVSPLIPINQNIGGGPTDPSILQSERIAPFRHNGGKKKKVKKQHGGDVLLGASAYTNNMSGAGTLDGATTGANTFAAGISNMNYATYSHPVDTKFHLHNLPIV